MIRRIELVLVPMYIGMPVCLLALALSASSARATVRSWEFGVDPDAEPAPMTEYIGLTTDPTRYTASGGYGSGAGLLGNGTAEFADQSGTVGSSGQFLGGNYGFVSAVNGSGNPGTPIWTSTDYTLDIHVKVLQSVGESGGKSMAIRQSNGNTRGIKLNTGTVAIVSSVDIATGTVDLTSYKILRFSVQGGATNTITIYLWDGVSAWTLLCSATMGGTGASGEVPSPGIALGSMAGSSTQSGKFRIDYVRVDDASALGNTVGPLASSTTPTGCTEVIPEATQTRSAFQDQPLGGAATLVLHSKGTGSGGGNQYWYPDFYHSSYTIASGDHFVYDIYTKNGSGTHSGAVDLEGGLGNLRDSGIADQNGRNAHPNTDLSDVALNQWYHRDFDLSSKAGQTITDFEMGHEIDNGVSEFYARNVKIVNGVNTMLVAFDPNTWVPVGDTIGPGNNGYSSTLGPQKDPDPAGSPSYTMENFSSASVNYTVTKTDATGTGSCGCDWLSVVNPGPAPIAAGNSVTITTSIDTTGLLPGTYTGYLRFDDGCATAEPYKLRRIDLIIIGCASALTPSAGIQTVSGLVGGYPVALASVDLGSPDVPDGLSVIGNNPTFDGNTVPAEIGGRSCRRNLDTAKDGYIFFAIDNARAHAGNQPNVDIVIEYYDTGTGSLALQYDAGTGNEYADGGSVAMLNDNQWKTHTFTITGARFSEGQAWGGDFRFGTDFQIRYLDKVSVRVTGNHGPTLDYTLSNTGGTTLNWDVIESNADGTAHDYSWLSLTTTPATSVDLATGASASVKATINTTSMPEMTAYLKFTDGCNPPYIRRIDVTLTGCSYTVGPDPVAVLATGGCTTPSTRTFAVINNGATTITSFNVDTVQTSNPFGHQDYPWLPGTWPRTISTTLAPGESEELPVTIDWTQLSAGSQQDAMLKFNISDCPDALGETKVKLTADKIDVPSAYQFIAFDGTSLPWEDDSGGLGNKFDAFDTTGSPPIESLTSRCTLVTNDAEAVDQKALHLDDSSLDQTKFYSIPAANIVATTGATVVGRLKTLGFSNAGTPRRTGNLWIWGPSISAQIFWGGDDGWIREGLRGGSRQLNLGSDPGGPKYHTVRVTSRDMGGSLGIVIDVYFDENQNPTPVLHLTNQSAQDSPPGASGFGFGVISGSDVQPIDFDCFAGTDAGAFAPGEEVACGIPSLVCPVPTNPCIHPWGAWADTDHDGDVDLNDFAVFQLCYTGSDLGPIPATPEYCACMDRGDNNPFDDQPDFDGDIDAADLTAFTNCYTGPDIPWIPGPPCNNSP